MYSETSLDWKVAVNNGLALDALQSAHLAEIITVYRTSYSQQCGHLSWKDHSKSNTDTWKTTKDVTYSWWFSEERHLEIILCLIPIAWTFKSNGFFKTHLWFISNYLVCFLICKRMAQRNILLVRIRSKRIDPFELKPKFYSF